MTVLPSGFRATVSSPLGDLSFFPSSSATDYYEARIYDSLDVLVATKYLGKSEVYADGKIKVNIRTTLDALPPGDYDVRVFQSGPGGTSESATGTPYIVPLSLP